MLACGRSFKKIILEEIWLPELQRINILTSSFINSYGGYKLFIWVVNKNLEIEFG